MRAAAARASRSKRSRRSGSPARRTEHLQRNAASEGGVLREIDLAHAAGAEQPFNPIVPEHTSDHAVLPFHW